MPAPVSAAQRAADVVRREAAVLQYDRPNVTELKSSWLKVRSELAYVKFLAAGKLRYR